MKLVQTSIKSVSIPRLTDWWNRALSHSIDTSLKTLANDLLTMIKNVTKARVKKSRVVDTGSWFLNLFNVS